MSLQSSSGVRALLNVMLSDARFQHKDRGRERNKKGRVRAAGRKALLAKSAQSRQSAAIGKTLGVTKLLSGSCTSIAEIWVVGREEIQSLAAVTCRKVVFFFFTPGPAACASPPKRGSDKREEGGPQQQMGSPPEWENNEISVGVARSQPPDSKKKYSRTQRR